MKLLFDRDARGNKLCPCKIPDPYLKKTKKSLNFKNSDNFGSKKKKKKKSDFNSVFTNTKNSEYKCLQH